LPQTRPARSRTFRELLRRVSPWIARKTRRHTFLSGFVTEDRDDDIESGGGGNRTRATLRSRTSITAPGGEMTQPLVYVDRSKVREGALAQLKSAIRELADYVEENEPRLISYSVYFSEDDSEMTVVHVHGDAASLDHHMEVLGP